MDVPTLGQFVGTLVLGTGLVLSQKLGSAQDAIRHRSSQKAVALKMGISESRLTRKLQADSDTVLNLRDLDRMDDEIQRDFHFREVLRLGLPHYVEKAVHLAAKLRHLKRSA